METFGNVYRKVDEYMQRNQRIRDDMVAVTKANIDYMLDLGATSTYVNFTRFVKYNRYVALDTIQDIKKMLRDAGYIVSDKPAKKHSYGLTIMLPIQDN